MSANPKQAIPHWFLTAYMLLTIAACLYPFSNWHNSGLSNTAFLFAPWPKYYIVSDLVANVIGYIPLGGLLTLSLPLTQKSIWRILLTVFIAFLFSLSLEYLQNFLPSRVASNIDILLNVIGALLGSLLALRWNYYLLSASRWLQEWRNRRFISGPLGDIGLLLILLWWVSLLTPETMLFANGDIRKLLHLPSAVIFEPGQYARVETIITAFQLIAFSCLMRCLMVRPKLLTIIVFVTIGLAFKSISIVGIENNPGSFFWLTKGATYGLCFGLPLAFCCFWLSPSMAQALGLLSLIFVTAIVNSAPSNPYFGDVESFGFTGLANMHGTTLIISNLWPFLALLYLILLEYRGKLAR